MAVLDDFKLDGRVALVTGGARGLGRGIAVGLAEAGADVVVLDIVPSDETGEEISSLGRRFHAMNADLRETDAADAARVVDECVEQMGRLDILVNNAGIIRRGTALEFGEDGLGGRREDQPLGRLLPEPGGRLGTSWRRDGGARSSTPPPCSPTRAA